MLCFTKRVRFLFDILEVSETTEIVSQSEDTVTEQAVTEETADRTESTESTDATELDETTEISDTAETEISEETETEKESGATQILAGTYDAVIGGTYSGVCENQGDYYLYYVTLQEAGKLTIAMTAQMEKCEVSVYSTDEEELYSHTEDCNENTKRVVASYEVYLTAGTYYIKVMEATAVLNL